MDDLIPRGVEHFNAGRFAEALACFRGAISAGERVPEARCLLAHVLDAAQRPDEAVAEFASVAAAFPLHWPAYAGLANMIMRRGALPGAGKTLSRAAALKPPDAEARRALVETLRLCARAWRASGDLAAAEKALERALRLAPADKESRRRLLEILHMREQAYLAAELSAPTEEPRREALAKLRLRAQSALAAGRTGSAEKALRAALVLGPNDKESRRQLAALLERASGRLVAGLRRRGLAHVAAGRLAEAERTLRRALASSPRDKEARKMLLDVLRMRGQAPPPDQLDLAEKALRRALALEPRDRETRRRLLDVFHRRAQARLAEGSLEAADRMLTKALAFEPGDAETKRRLAEVLNLRARACQSAGRRRQSDGLARRILGLAPRDARAHLSRGDVLFISGRVREGRALLGRALKLDRGELSPAERFKTLMKLGRRAEAIAAAERILDASPTLDDLRAFWDPWEWDERRGRAERHAELRELERALKGSAAAPWLHYYRGDLAGPEGLADFERIAEHPAGRYGWMFFKAGTAALLAGRFAKAAEWFRAALAREPVDWRARAFLGEAYLCLRRPDDAFAAMDRALLDAPATETGQVLAWRGAFDLWLGRYEEALARLEEAGRLGAQCAFCWKAGALLKLGRDAEALKALDDTLRRYPLDFEARVWRGEALRRLGRHREALKDLSVRTLTDPSRPAPVWQWALFNRALVKRALGDEKGMRADFRAILPRVVAHIRDTKGLPLGAEPSAAEMAAILEAGLELSRGFRREEYEQAIWTG